MPPPASRGGPLDSVSAGVETTQFRALVVVRLVVTAYAVTLNAVRWREFERPVLAWFLIGVLVSWTLVTIWAYDSPRRRGLPLLVADLGVTAALLLSTPWVESAQMQARNASTLPSFWIVGAVLAWAVARGWRAGIVVAAVVSLLDLVVRTDPNGTTAGNIFLLLLAAGVVGHDTALTREATEARAAAERTTAALAERARLARAVHDGVLQVLALVQRKGAEIGGEAADLGRLAGQQEVALRALVQGTAEVGGLDGTGAASGATARDLVGALALLGSPAVTVSGPAEPVLLPAEVVAELRSVVRACLDNVAAHVGPDAPAWVLVEELEKSVMVTVRDEGPGIAPGRLEEARTQGRLGVSESIEGRMHDLGGTVDLLTGTGLGTEWELRVARPPTRRSRR